MKRVTAIVLLAAACAPPRSGPPPNSPANPPATVPAQPQGPTTLADTVALELAMYTAALDNGTSTAHAAAQPELVCVQGADRISDPRPSVFEALRKDRTILIRPMSACITEPLRSGQRGLSLVVDTLTGKRGISIWASRPFFAADGTFSFETRYYQHGLSGAGWICNGRRLGAEQWEIASCKMQWIS